MNLQALAAAPFFALLCGCVLPPVLPDALGGGLQGVSEERAGPAPALQTQVRMVFPAAFSTLGEAAGYLLAPHAYRPAPGAADNAVAGRPLMAPQRLEPVSLYLALQRLLGEDGQIVLDQESRLFLFRVRGVGEASVAFAPLTGVATPAPAAPVAAPPPLRNEPAPVAIVAPPPPRNGPAPVAAVTPPPPRNDPAPVATAAPPPPRNDPAPVAPVSPPPPRNNPTPVAAVAPPLPRNGPAPIATAAPPRNGPAPVAVVAPPVPQNNIGPVQAAPRPASPESCDAIQFKRRVMLSRIVKDYLSQCGFTEVSWKIGKPGSYTDYRILQDAKVPLPGRHKDLIQLLQVRFGIKTRIHDDNRIDFYDEKSLL